MRRIESWDVFRDSGLGTGWTAMSFSGKKNPGRDRDLELKEITSSVGAVELKMSEKPSK